MRNKNPQSSLLLNYRFPRLFTELKRLKEYLLIQLQDREVFVGNESDECDSSTVFTQSKLSLP